MTPNRKVTAGGLGGALAMVLVWGLGELGVDVPAEVAAALSTVVGFGLAYFTNEPAKEDA